MRAPNKMNTKPFERLLKWQRKENIFDFKGRRRKGKSVLFLSLKKREIEGKKVPYLSRKITSKQGNKSDSLGERKRGSKPTNLLLS